MKKSSSFYEKYIDTYNKIYQKAQHSEFEKLQKFSVDQWNGLDQHPLPKSIIKALDQIQDTILKNDPKEISAMKEGLEIDPDARLNGELFELRNINEGTNEATLVEYNMDWSNREDLDSDYRWKIWKDGGNGITCQYLSESTFENAKASEKNCREYLSNTFRHLDDIIEDLNVNPTQTRRIHPIIR